MSTTPSLGWNRWVALTLVRETTVRTTKVITTVAAMTAAIRWIWITLLYLVLRPRIWLIRVVLALGMAWGGIVLRIWRLVR